MDDAWIDGQCAPVSFLLFFPHPFNHQLVLFWEKVELEREKHGWITNDSQIRDWMH